MDIELTGTTQKKNIAVLQNPALKLLFNQPQVNGYSLELKSANNLQLPASAGGYLLIGKSETVIEFKTNTSVQDRIMKPSHYIWTEPGNKLTIKNMHDQEASFVLLQFK